MFKGFLLLLHPALAIISIILIVWLICSIKCNDINEKKIKNLSTLIAILSIFIWIIAGYWYVVFYPTDKAMLIKGSWDFAHKFFMESKEHIFFIFLILSLYLPIVTFTNNIKKNKIVQNLIITIGVLLLVLIFYMDGAGAIISYGSKISYMLKDGL